MLEPGLSQTNEITYEERVQAEIEHYLAEYQTEESQRTLTQKVPPSWFFVEDRLQSQIRQANEGRGMIEEIVHQLKMHPGGRALSLGSGPGGVELELARQLSGCDYEIVCLDINPHLLELGRARAQEEGLNVKFEVQDLNDLTLEPNSYDVIFCHASLHHVINLEQVFYEMNRALKAGGEIIVVDIVTRNGYLMWDETHDFVRALWRILPDKFKFSHTGYAEIRLDEDYPNRDYTDETMECIRSQDIQPLLDQYFTTKVFVPSTAISRRFFDTMYGPNYDLTQQLDQSILEFIWQLDLYCLAQGILKPETMFGIYTKGPERDRPPKYSEQQNPAAAAPLESEPPRLLPAQVSELEDTDLQSPAPVALQSSEPTPLSTEASEPGLPGLTEWEIEHLRHFLWVYQMLRQSWLYRWGQWVRRVLKSN